MKRISLESPNANDYKEPLLKGLKNSCAQIIIDPYSRFSSKEKKHFESNKSFKNFINELKKDKKYIRIKKTFHTSDKILMSVSKEIYMNENEENINNQIYYFGPFKYNFRKRRNFEVERFDLNDNVNSFFSFKKIFSPYKQK
jgi:hypothetical protein